MQWITPDARCGESSHCLQYAEDGATVWLRSTKRPDQPPMAASRDEWDAFVTGLRVNVSTGS